MFNWFDQADEFMRSAERMRQQVEVGEDFLASRRSVRGYCACCQSMVRFRVKTGASFAGVPNLREGMACRHCKMSNRSRLMWHAINDSLGENDDALVALLEAGSPLCRQLLHRYPKLTGSEYLGDEHVSGQTYSLRRKTVRHESVLSLSYADASLDLIAHNDVLEHVENYKVALIECLRVLSPGGQLIFTMPFFMFLKDNLLRGRTLADGTVEHLQSPEYHGDGVRPQGIYTWHHFGWRLLADLREAGFCKSEIGLNYDPFAGYVSNHHPQFNVGLMLPVVFRATR
jgi:SAM-dependent methyltransferase